MDNVWHLLIDAGIILILILGISQFRTPKGARAGNLIAACALLCALGAVLYRNPIMDLPVVVLFVVLGGLVGWWVAMRVNMIQIPAMVAFQNGAGGAASFLVCFVELTRDRREVLETIGEVSGILALAVGAATFSASMIASGKLANRLKQTPTVFRQHNVILIGIALIAIALGVVAAIKSTAQVVICCLVALILISMILGIVFSIRIGGADMPVLISFLNASTGLAAALCGLAVENRLLIACGATVAASGSILTHVMCQAMNRGLTGVFAGIQTEPAGSALQPVKEKNQKAAAGPAPSPTIDEPQTPKTNQGRDPLLQAVETIKSAQSVIIVPGYGMALAEAECEVVQLSEKLAAMGKQVRFAVHPVAGRMPGHMHVLLAEAEVDYDNLFEIDDINAEFSQTDLVLVVGACDVVNPAALDVKGTPISGMPILLTHEARHVVVCNLDEKPGYSGVENPLYDNPKTILLLGDAKETVQRILESMSTAPGC